MSNKLYSPLIQDPVTKQFYKHELNTHTGIVLKTQQKFINNLIKQRDQFKSERDTLTDDIAVLKAKVIKLKRENGELQEVIEDKNSDLLFTEDEIIQLEKDFENKHNLLSEISQYIGNKPSSSTYKYFRAKLDELGIEEGE